MPQAEVIMDPQTRKTIHENLTRLYCEDDMARPAQSLTWQALVERTKAAAQFKEALEWVSRNYERHSFWCERDVVWTVERKLRELVNEGGPRRLVLPEYPMRHAGRRSECADLVIREHDETVLVVEFKYEPDYRRPEFAAYPAQGRRRLPVVAWKSVERDIERVQEYVASNRAKAGVAVLIDEGGYWQSRRKELPWVYWGGNRWLYIKGAAHSLRREK